MPANARRIRLATMAALCAFVVQGTFASGAERAPALDPMLAARVDALLDANAVGRRIDGMFDQLGETMREQASSADGELRAKSEVVVALIEVARWDQTRDLWRDAVSREIDLATLSAAEAFFTSPVGDGFRRCVAKAKTYPSDYAACAAEVSAIDTAASHFTRGDFPVDRLSLSPTLTAIMCRYVRADDAFLARVHAACRRTGATPPESCEAVRTDLPTSAVNDAACGVTGATR